MIKIITALGQINLWNNNKLEFVDSDFDGTKNKITLTFLFRDSTGKIFSNDKLKLYGVKNIDEALVTFESIRKNFESVDFATKNEIRLFDNQGTLLQIIKYDKRQYSHTKVRTA